jgi:hypothetical protein
VARKLQGSRWEEVVMERSFTRFGIQLTLGVLVVVVARAASAQTAVEGQMPVQTVPEATAAAAPAPVGPWLARPRLALSYRRFAISNLDRSPVPLEGLELDLYPISTAWLRAGLEVEAGRGQAAASGSDVDLRYGLGGVTLGLQYPGRLTPFVEGRLTGGVLAGTFDGALPVPGASVSAGGTSAATWIYGRGVDVGVELYTIGRLYLTGTVGWLRTTWRGVDTAALAADPSGGYRFKDLTGDSFTFKLGVGF